MIGVTDRICGFIKEEFLVEDQNAVIGDDTPLLDGIIDSMALLQLVAFLEEEFDIEVDDTEITADHFRTVNAIKQLLESKVA